MSEEWDEDPEPVTPLEAVRDTVWVWTAIAAISILVLLNTVADRILRLLGRR